MWFVSKKKYDAMVAERDRWDGIAAEAIAQNGRLLTQIDGAIKKMEEIQGLNHQLVKHNDALLTRIKELEAEKEGLELRVAILNTDYDALDYAHVHTCRKLDTVCEERDHYEERCRYLEDELLHYQEGNEDE